MGKKVEKDLKPSRGKYAYALISLAGISGFVMDAEGRFINGAKVIVRDLETVTNENGRFSLSIPPPQQQQRQTLYISKPGYRTWSGFVYPAQGQELQVRLEGE
jgi:hypothetical protein